MKISKSLVSKLIFNKFFLQLIIAAFMIGMAIFFIRHEHLEVLSIREQLAQSNPWYITLGIALTGIYLLLQAQMYVNSFKSIGTEIPYMVALRLFLKRNLISVLLPAGGFTSLAFFTSEVEDREVTKSQIHLASTLFAFISILSVVVVAIPILGYSLLMYDLQQAEVLGFGFLLLLIFSFFLFIYSVAKKGKAYQWLYRIRPSLSLILDEMIAQKIIRKQVWIVLVSSTIIEIIGILHLYVAMMALGYEPSWPAATIGYVVMVIILVASPFLRGLGAIEVSLTFILGQFGFPIVAAASIVLLYRFFEFWLPLVAGLFSFISSKDNLILRMLPACIIFILGIVNIISAITPSVPTRLMLIQKLLPDEIIAYSNGLVLVLGLLLIILSAFLLQGSKRAWYIALSLAFLSLIGHLLKAIDYEEAILAFLALSSLLYTRKLYKLKPHPKFTRISYLVLIYSVIALLSFGVIGLYFIDKVHFGIDFEFWVAVKTILRLFFLLDGSDLNPRTGFAQNFLYTIYISGGGVLCFVFFNLLRTYFTKPFNTDEDWSLAKNLLEKYGKSTLDYFKTYPDKLLFFAEKKDGFIAFKVARHFAIVLENPICKDEISMIHLIRDFDRFCDDNGFISIFYRVPESSLEIYHNLGKKSIPLGEEAIVDLTSFTLDGGRMKSIRNAISHLTTEGYEVKTYNAPIKEGLLQKLEQVSDNWLQELNQKEIGFTQGVFDKSILKNQTIITVEDKEEMIHAFLNVIPDYAPGEATYDLIRKGADAPNGILDLLLAKTLLYFKEQGNLSANIGMAPLSGIEGGSMTEKSMNYAYESLKTFSHFKGLRNYKEKFFPTWKQKYLIYNNSYHLLQVPTALKRVM